MDDGLCFTWRKTIDVCINQYNAAYPVVSRWSLHCLVQAGCVEIHGVSTLAQPAYSTSRPEELEPSLGRRRWSRQAVRFRLGQVSSIEGTLA